MVWGKECRAKWKAVRTERYGGINRQHKVYIHRFTGMGQSDGQKQEGMGGGVGVENHGQNTKMK